MVINIPKVEPFTFQASTAFDERVQLADKLNEVIDALNLVGDIPDMQTEIDELKQSVASLQESIGSTDTNLATVEGNLNKAISDLNALTARVSALETTVTEHTSDIAENTSEIAGLKTRMTTAENDIDTAQADIVTIEGDIQTLDNDVEALQREVVDEVSMASTAHGTVQVTIHHEDGTQDTSAPIDLALVQEGGITLQTGATDRSFNLKVTLSDGSSWQTNDFVIPEGGGTDVSVTSIQISQGTSANQIRVKIGLSDGSFINSNDWTVVTPAEFGTLKTTVQGNTGDIASLEGRATALETQMDTVDTEISGLDDRVTALEGSPGYNLPVATASVLGGVKIGGNITVQADGTISVPVVSASTPGVVDTNLYSLIQSAGTAATLHVTRDARGVHVEISNISGSEFSEDIPVATNTLPGLMSASDKTKMNNIPDPSTIATDTEVSDLQDQISEIGPTVTINDSVTPSQITVAVNGKTSTANLPTSKPTITSEPTFIRIESSSDFATMLSTIQAIPDNSVVLLTIVNGYSRPSNSAYGTDGITVGCIGVKTTGTDNNVTVITGGVAHTGSDFTSFEQFIPINKITFSSNNIQLTMYTNGGTSTADLSKHLDSNMHAIRVVLTKIL